VVFGALDFEATGGSGVSDIEGLSSGVSGVRKEVLFDCKSACMDVGM